MSLTALNSTTPFLVGPILDSAGAAKTNEVIGSIKVTKNGVPGDANAGSTLVHSHTGHYVYTPAAGDHDTLGEAVFSLNSGANAMQPVRQQVIAAALYAAMVSSYSATRGLSGTALPAAAADAAGGLPISGAGGADIDALAATVAKLETMIEEVA